MTLRHSALQFNPAYGAALRNWPRTLICFFLKPIRVRLRRPAASSKARRPHPSAGTSQPRDGESIQNGKCRDAHWPECNRWQGFVISTWMGPGRPRLPADAGGFHRTVGSLHRTPEGRSGQNVAISTERAPMAGATTGSTRPRSAGARRRLSLRETRTGKPSARRMSSATTRACGRAWHRFTRLTNAFSRKIQNHVHMAAPVRLHAHSRIASRDPGQGSRAHRQDPGHGGVYPDHGRSRAGTESAQTIQETEGER